MEVFAEDIVVHAFDPDDGTRSSAIKVAHRLSRQEVVNADTHSQRDNFRRALRRLIDGMNPNPDGIPPPKLVLFDRVQVRLPQSTHGGQIERMSWDFRREEWKYFVQCAQEVVSSWYVAADLDLADEG